MGSSHFQAVPGQPALSQTATETLLLSDRPCKLMAPWIVPGGNSTASEPSLTVVVIGWIFESESNQAVNEIELVPGARP